MSIFSNSGVTSTRRGVLWGGILASLGLALAPATKAFAAPISASDDFSTANAETATLDDTIEILYVRAVKDGKNVSYVFSGDQLKANQPLLIDGYVIGVYSFNRDGITTNSEGNSLGNLDAYDGGAGLGLTCGNCSDNIETEDLATPAFDQQFFDKLLTRRLQDQDGDSLELPNSYCFGVFNGWKPISERECVSLVYGSDNDETETKFIELRHSAPMKVKKIEGVQFWYFGNNYQKFSRRNNADSKIFDVYEGVRNVEEFFGTSLIDRINLVDFDEDNAAAEKNEGTIHVLKGSLQNRRKKLVSTIEHETLHRFVFESGYSESDAIRQLYNGFFGQDLSVLCFIGGDCSERVDRDKLGRFADYVSDYGNKPFFEFINEKSYFGLKEGGHSHGNVWEFCTSFFHTLMYFDKFERNLKKLSQEDKTNVLACYEFTLNSMIGINESYDSLLKDRLETVRQYK